MVFYLPTPPASPCILLVVQYNKSRREYLLNHIKGKYYPPGDGVVKEVLRLIVLTSLCSMLMLLLALAGGGVIGWW